MLGHSYYSVRLLFMRAFTFTPLRVAGPALDKSSGCYEMRATKAEAVSRVSKNTKNILLSRKLLGCSLDHIQCVMFLPCPFNASCNGIIDGDLCPE